MRVPHTSVRVSLARICQPCVTHDYHIRRGLAESSVNHYDVLGLKPTASPSEIKSAYYTLSKKYHPDVAVDVADAREKFAKLSSAYEVLSNPNRRALYDRTLHPSMSRPTSHAAGSNMDIEYRDFLRRRGSFQQRTGAQASSRTSAGMRYNYEEFLRHQQYGRATKRNFQQKIRQQQNADQAQAVFVFLMFAVCVVVQILTNDKPPRPWWASRLDLQLPPTACTQLIVNSQCRTSSRHRCRLHGGGCPHDWKVMGVMPQVTPHRNFVMSSFLKQ